MTYLTFLQIYEQNDYNYYLINHILILSFKNEYLKTKSSTVRELEFINHNRNSSCTLLKFVIQIHMQLILAKFKLPHFHLHQNHSTCTKYTFIKRHITKSQLLYDMLQVQYIHILC